MRQRSAPPACHPERSRGRRPAAPAQRRISPLRGRSDARSFGSDGAAARRSAPAGSAQDDKDETTVTGTCTTVIRQTPITPGTRRATGSIVPRRRPCVPSAGFSRLSLSARGLSPGHVPPRENRLTTRPDRNHGAVPLASLRTSPPPGRTQAPRPAQGATVRGRGARRRGGGRGRGAARRSGG